MDLLRLWAPGAPEPSYGWWPLAAHLLRAKMAPGAEAIARKAQRSSREASPEIKRFVLGHLMAWAIDQGDKVRMLRWLEAGEAL